MQRLFLFQRIQNHLSVQKLHGVRLLRFSHKDAYSPVADAAGEHLYPLRCKQQHRPRQRRGVRRLAGKAYFTAGAAARYPGKVRRLPSRSART